MVNEIVNSVTPYTDIERKRVLTAANADFIELDSSVVLSGDFEISIKIDYAEASNFIYGGGVGFNSYFRIITQGRCEFRLDDSSLTTFYTVDTIPRSGLYTLTVERVGLVLNLYVDGGLVASNACTNSNFTLDDMGRYGANYTDTEWHEVDIDGDLYSLNEGNGTTLTSSSGNTATQNTAHADGLNYINLETVKRV